MFVFIPLELLVHILEELLRFPAWASKHFGKTSLDWYLASHVVIYPIVFIITYQASRGGNLWIFVAVTVQTVLFTNGLFHLATTLLFKEYSPGLISSVLVTFPFSFIFYRSILLNQILPFPILEKSVALGSVVSLLIIGSLYLNFDFKLFKR